MSPEQCHVARLRENNNRWRRSSAGKCHGAGDRTVENTTVCGLELNRLCRLNPQVGENIRRNPRVLASRVDEH